VRTDPKITDFIEKAIATGIPRESLVGILTARGWTEKDVYEALADYYQRLTGIDIPRRSGTGASAKEAFFYLLLFATLATWTIGFGYLAFALIDRWLADPLFSSYPQVFETHVIPSSIAALMVAFPLYLLISRAVLKETVQHPEAIDSPIRKWLTYMALVVAATVFMGDLIAALTYLLRGELTSRFLAKFLVVLGLSGGVFFYYFGGLRKTDISSTTTDRDRIMAAVCSSVVVIIVALGFWQLGSPNTQRELRADNQRVHQLYQLNMAMNGYWSSHSAKLPSSIDQLSRTYTDPITGVPYAYHPKQGSEYELCATFTRASDSREMASPPNPWIHPAGYHCYSLDAAFVTQLPLSYFGN
jgi:uncharacterized protein DUF5671